MNITADTNVLARAVLQDDLQQSRIAQQQLQQAELVAVTLPPCANWCGYCTGERE